MLAGGIVNIVLNTIAEGIYPNYSLRTNALSDLGALEAPTALLWFKFACPHQLTHTHENGPLADRTGLPDE